MFGPAYGHNIIPFLEYFNEDDASDLTFIHNSKNTLKNQFSKIKFLHYTFINLFSIFSFIKIVRDDFDLIWNHGGYNALELLLIFLFKRKNTKFVINVWGERIPHLASLKNLRGSLYRYLYGKCDYITCLWYGTKDLWKAILPKHKVGVDLWGLHRAYFKPNTKVLNSFTQQFIDSMDKQKMIFFYPKSITTASHHLLLLDAIKSLEKKDSMLVYFWLGNTNNLKIRTEVEEKIKEYELSDVVKLVDHPFLDFEDMIAIWNHVDVGIQIVNNDQLSTTLLEPLLLKKEVMISKIKPYEKFVEVFPSMELKLITNRVESIQDGFKELINGAKTSKLILEERSNIIKFQFNFHNNISKMVEKFKEI
ncbi:MAG: hypothetical protein J5I47_05410 [Vicingus serpentipes]|nr:hypothetical protein [Vicingus serpentipes]